MGGVVADAERSATGPRATGGIGADRGLVQGEPRDRGLLIERGEREFDAVPVEGPRAVPPLRRPVGGQDFHAPLGRLGNQIASPREVTATEVVLGTAG